jgi:DNA-binding transcriptional regulator YiaG
MSKPVATMTQQAHLSRQDLARRWSVHVITIKRWERAGHLKPQHLGPRTIRYPLRYIEQIEERGLQS